MAEVAAAGVRLRDPVPIPGLDWDVAWLDAADTHGVHLQFVRPHPKAMGRG